MSTGGGLLWGEGAGEKAEVGMRMCECMCVWREEAYVFREEALLPLLWLALGCVSLAFKLSSVGIRVGPRN